MPKYEDVLRVLNEPPFQGSGRHYDRCSLIARANSVGPPMRLLHWRRLEEAGHLPHYDTFLAEDAISAINRLGAPVVEIHMVSHRWLQSSTDINQSHPDDMRCMKASALIEFSKWRRNWVKRQHGFYPEIFYWVDYCCFNRAQLAESISMLPIWIACCERLVCFETPDYHDRAWCRLELLLSYVFGFADHHPVIGAGFQAIDGANGQDRAQTMQMPTEGQMTDRGDAAYIEDLQRFACHVQPFAQDRVSGKQLSRPLFGHTSIKRFLL